MNIKKISFKMTALATIFCVAGVTQAQPVINQGVPVQRGAVMQQNVPMIQQRSVPTYYNVTLTDEQKAQPDTGASFYDMGSGIAVRSVYTNSPAQKAGLNSGDMITKANGQAIQNVAAFNAMVSGMKAGDTVKLTKRAKDGKETEVDCQLMTLGDILQASIVPEAGVYDQAVMRAEQMLSGLQQQIKNGEAELADMKKRLADQEKQLADLKAKAAEARAQAEQQKAADEAKRQQQIEAMKKRAEEAGNTGDGN